MFTRTQFHFRVSRVCYSVCFAWLRALKMSSFFCSCVIHSRTRGFPACVRARNFHGSFAVACVRRLRARNFHVSRI